MMSFMSKPVIPTRWLFLTGYFLLAACSQSSTEDPTQFHPTSLPPTVTFTPAPTPLPTAIPTQSSSQSMEIANQAFFNGDWDAAEDAFKQVKEISADSNNLAEASLGLSKLYIFSDQYPEAIQELNTFLSTYADYGSVPDGHFLRALAYVALGEDDLAIEDFKRYLEFRPGILDSYVEKIIGEAQSRQGRPLAAIPHYERALQAPGLVGSFELRLKIGNSFLQAGEYEAALFSYEELFQESNSASTRAVLNLLIGRTLETMGDYEGAYERYLDSVVNYPEANETYLGLVTLVNAGVPVDDFQRGLIDYYAEAYEPALNAFSRVIEINPSGTAFYFRGLVRRELGDPWSAITNFQWVIDSYPNDPQWANAWWEKALTERRDLSDKESAIETLLSLVDSAPGNSRAAEALNRAAYLSEWQGFLENAEEIWMRIGEEYPGHTLACRGAFMSGVTRFRLQNYNTSRDAFLLAAGWALVIDDLAKGQ